MKRTIFDDTGKGLKEYRRKRDFKQTAEPPPRVKKKRSSRALMFVIQKHDATRLHYDFRLEMEGVLKSWAVPKGLPFTRGDRRLAVHVEDHPFSYAKFEGTIPPGNYGAGTVMVWDIGTYTVKDDDPLRALEDGKLHLTLAGKKLKGDWTLVRMKGRFGEDKENWLILKSGDNLSLPAEKDDESVLTGRSMARIAGENKKQWQSDRSASSAKKVEPRIAAAVAKRHQAEKSKTRHNARAEKTERLAAKNSSSDIKSLPNGKLTFKSPMKCKLVEKAPEGARWIYEIKFDGFRALAIKNEAEVHLISRNNKSLNPRFPAMVDAVRALPFRKGMIDGEIVALDEEGRSSFQLLQMFNMPGQNKAPLSFYAFDILNLEGKDLTSLPLKKRKEILQSLISPAHEPVRFSANIQGNPKRLLEEIKRRRLEGIIAKNIDSKYEVGQRSGCWQKIKVINTQEFVIGGFTPPKGSRDKFGAILVGYYKDDKLVFVSKVGSGFNQALLQSLHSRFQKLLTTTCPFANLPERGKFGGRGLTKSEMLKCTWIQPELIAEIRFTEWTRDDHLRHPVFQGLRDDLKPEEVRKEKP